MSNTRTINLHYFKINTILIIYHSLNLSATGKVKEQIIIYKLYVNSSTYLGILVAATYDWTDEGPLSV